MKKIAPILLIIIGISLISYPKLRECYYDYKQHKILQAWQESLSELDGSEDMGQSETLNPTEFDGQESSSTPGDRVESIEKYIAAHMEGILIIKKINLRLPILKGATKQNLNLSVSSLEGTAGPGQPGNYCIAGHRSRTRGRHFNRLNELEKGDIIEVLTDKGHFIYEVQASIIAKPEDIWVLLPQGREKLINLITCDYSEKPPLRLIVRGKLVEQSTK
ncbi:MAG: sortase [Tepidanaerobacteraceae bacterium]|nr:sortase [Tepidanaerobacteraceae bacterium]